MFTSYRDWLNQPIIERLNKMSDLIAQGETAAMAAFTALQAEVQALVTADINVGSVAAQAVLDIQQLQSQIAAGGTANPDPDAIVEFLGSMTAQFNTIGTNVSNATSMVVGSTGSLAAVLPAAPSPATP